MDRLISEDNALKAVQRACIELGFEPLGKEVNAICSELEKVPTVSNESVKGDLISRRTLLDYLLTENQICVGSTGHELTMNMITSFINNQPTVSNDGWIPCSERLPEEYGEYLVCNKYEVYGLGFPKKDNYGNVYVETDSEIITEVVAWMPLPEPYEQGNFRI